MICMTAAMSAAAEPAWIRFRSRAGSPRGPRSLPALGRAPHAGWLSRDALIFPCPGLADCGQPSSGCAVADAAERFELIVPCLAQQPSQLRVERAACHGRRMAALSRPSGTKMSSLAPVTAVNVPRAGV